MAPINLVICATVSSKTLTRTPGRGGTSCAWATCHVGHWLAGGGRRYSVRRLFAIGL